MYRRLLLISAFFVAFAFSAKAQTSEMCIETQPKPILPSNYGTLDVQTSVVIKADFAASGRIESIKLISDYSPSLSKLALEAVKNITFQPKLVDGNPVTVSKTLIYDNSWQYSGWKISRFKSLSY